MKTEPSLLPAWTPSPEYISTTNIAWLMQHIGVDSYEALHAWSVRNREAFWATVIQRLGVRFHRTYDRVADFSAGIESPQWLPGAKLNIVESCFSAPADSPAIIYQAEAGKLATVSIGELQSLSARVAAGLARRGFTSGDALAILMPMTVECVAIYLGILQAGGVVVSIADSFRPKEIATRLRLANAVGIFTQEIVRRGDKSYPLYAGLAEAKAPPAIVLLDNNSTALREGDCVWRDFLGDNVVGPPVLRESSDPINLLFSSGTTGDPKVIPWTQTTPIKCAADAHFHQDIRPGDVVVWPTNIGWMMGPWLIFSSLMNRATLGLHYGVPTGQEFCRFVQDSRATMLGVVPSLVKTWRSTGCRQGLDWSAIKVFSTTGECSNPQDMRWLIEQPGGRPVIEYCGGTEIGGGYLTGTVTRPCVPGTFNTPALGLDIVVLDADGRSTDEGELFIVPPSIGLSSTLLNKNHHEVYYANTPKGPHDETLRRHGDEVKRLPNGYWRACGRVDDTMNLGGIKVSSTEIERVAQSVPGVKEVAAIAVSPCGGGPSQLILYAVGSTGERPRKEELLPVMQNAIKRDLNPLFKIHNLVFVDALPRNASNKVMRRLLRDEYISSP